MCDAAGYDAEYAGMAVYTPHGGRGRSAAGRRESQRTDGRSGYRSGYRPRRLDTRMGTMVDSSHLVSIAFKRASKYSSWLQV